MLLKIIHDLTTVTFDLRSKSDLEGYFQGGSKSCTSSCSYGTHALFDVKRQCCCPHLPSPLKDSSVSVVNFYI